LNASIGVAAALGTLMTILWTRDAQLSPFAVAGAFWAGQVALGMLPVLLYGRSRRAADDPVLLPLASSPPREEDSSEAVAHIESAEAVEEELKTPVETP
jgi:hypothetical protein